MKKLLFLAFLFSFEASALVLPKLVPYRKGDKWGYADSARKMIIPAGFDYALPFYGRTAVVMLNHAYGMIDTTGSFVVPCLYKNIDEKAHQGIRIVTDKNDFEGLVNEDGIFTFPFSDVWFWWLSDQYLYGFEVKKITSRSRGAIMDRNGQWITGLDYDAWDRNDILVNDSLFIMAKRGKQGVIDAKGRTVIPFRYEFIYADACGNLFASTKDSVYRYDKKLDRSVPGTYQVTCKNDSVFKPAYYYCDSRTCAGWKRGNDTAIVRTDYERTDYFYAGYARFVKDGLYGFVNDRFVEVLPAQYKIVGDCNVMGLAMCYREVTRKDRKGVSETYFDPIGYIDMYGTKYWDFD